MDQIHDGFNGLAIAAVWRVDPTFGAYRGVAVEHDAGDLGAAEIHTDTQAAIQVGCAAHVTLLSWRGASITGTTAKTTRTFEGRLMIRKKLRFLGYVIATRLVVGAIPFGRVDGAASEV